MPTLKIRTRERKNLPYGKYRYVIELPRTSRRVCNALTNASQLEEVRDFLKTAAKGRYRLVWQKNNYGRRVYTQLLLEESMDVFILKMTFHSKFRKLYEIKLSTDESDESARQTES
jgi:hypothetical protein